LTAVLSRIVHRLGRWRLIFLFFLIAYTALLLLYLDYAAIRWWTAVKPWTASRVHAKVSILSTIIRRYNRFVLYIFGRKRALSQTCLTNFRYPFSMGCFRVRLSPLWTKNSSAFKYFASVNAWFHHPLQSGVNRNYVNVLFFNLTVLILLLDAIKQ